MRALLRGRLQLTSLGTSASDSVGDLQKARAESDCHTGERPLTSANECLAGWNLTPGAL